MKIMRKAFPNKSNEKKNHFETKMFQVRLKRLNLTFLFSIKIISSTKSFQINKVPYNKHIKQIVYTSVRKQAQCNYKNLWKKKTP